MAERDTGRKRQRYTERQIQRQSQRQRDTEWKYNGKKHTDRDIHRPTDTDLHTYIYTQTERNPRYTSNFLLKHRSRNIKNLTASTFSITATSA